MPCPLNLKIRSRQEWDLLSYEEQQAKIAKREAAALRKTIRETNRWLKEQAEKEKAEKKRTREEMEDTIDDIIGSLDVLN